MDNDLRNKKRTSGWGLIFLESQDKKIKNNTSYKEKNRLVDGTRMSTQPKHPRLIAISIFLFGEIEAEYITLP